MSEISGRLGGPRDDDGKDPSEAWLDALDARSGRWMRRHEAGSVAVLTLVVDGVYRGTTLSAWMVVSIEPLQVLVSLEEDNSMTEWVLGHESFALSLLPRTEQLAADRFAGLTPRASPTFDDTPHFLAPSGAPILARCIAWADCAVVGSVRTGDHLCLVGEVRFLGRGDGDERDPLIYYLNRYHRLR